MGVVASAVSVVMEIPADVRSEGGPADAQDAIPVGVAGFVVEWAVVDATPQIDAVVALGSGAMTDHSYVVVVDVVVVKVEGAV